MPARKKSGNNPAVTKAPPPIIPTKGGYTRGGKQRRAEPQAPSLQPAALDPRRFDAFIGLDWWTVKDAANIIAGICPPESDFDMHIATGGARARLYFSFKNATLGNKPRLAGPPGSGALHTPNPYGRIKPADALRYAIELGVQPPPELMPMLNQANSMEPEILTDRRKTTLLRAIGMLLVITLEGKGGARKHPSFADKTELIELLQSEFPDVFGLAKRNMEEIFKDAQDALKSAQNEG